MRGFVNINKSADGMTSSDVVVIVRGILRRALGQKLKVGHLGTLDPLAGGVLPIAVGTATRLFDYSQQKIKTYRAVFKFGEQTDTLDRGGQIVKKDDKQICADDIISVLDGFKGDILQIPPQYSAKSVGGKRAYDVAREGGEVKLEAKKVHVYDIKLLGADENNALNSENFENNTFSFEISCGSGTYIRALARDIAEAIGTVGYMTSLTRTKSGAFSIENAISIEEFSKNPLGNILPIDAIIDGETLTLSDGEAERALSGIKIPCDKSLKAPFAVSAYGDIVGLGEIVCGKLKLTTRL